MLLTPPRRQAYEEDGLVLLPDSFSTAETDLLRRELDVLANREHPGRIFESDGRTVRALHGCHLHSEVFLRLTRLRRLVEPAQQVLGSEVYVHQFKINTKAAFSGDVWPWHQDFIFWSKEDGMPSPRVVNAVIFLDEVHELNGPLSFVPGSQREGSIDVLGRETTGSWVDNVSANLKYSLDRDTVARLAAKRGFVVPKGPRGSLLLFHCDLAHASAPNISPDDRRLIIVSYNSTANVPVSREPRRPEFLISRDSTPIDPLPDRALLGDPMRS